LWLFAAFNAGIVEKFALKYDVRRVFIEYNGTVQQGGRTSQHCSSRLCRRCPQPETGTLQSWDGTFLQDGGDHDVYHSDTFVFEEIIYGGWTGHGKYTLLGQLLCIQKRQLRTA
jgi:hypothetical protein